MYFKPILHLQSNWTGNSLFSSSAPAHIRIFLQNSLGRLKEMFILMWNTFKSVNPQTLPSLQCQHLGFATLGQLTVTQCYHPKPIASIGGSDLVLCFCGFWQMHHDMAPPCHYGVTWNTFTEVCLFISSLPPTLSPKWIFKNNLSDQKLLPN